jgi:2'-5' RNA ligase
VRVFLAVPCPRETSAALDRAAALLPRARWRTVAAEARHVTLRFLGEQAPEAVRAVVATAARVLAGHRAFELALVGVGAFPDVRRPRVVWAGCSRGGPELAVLMAALDAALAAEAGLPPDPRPARPHLTLARRRDGVADREAEADAQALIARYGTTAWGQWSVRAATLYRSDLGPAGPRYTPLAELPLGPAAAAGAG